MLILLLQGTSVSTFFVCVFFFTESMNYFSIFHATHSKNIFM